MELSELQSIVAGALTGSPPDGDFSLDAAALDSSLVTTLWENLFGQPKLVLTNATVNTDTSQPSAAGMLASELQPAYSFLAGFEVAAVFELFDLDGTSTPQLQLTLTPPPSSPFLTWGLPDALPDYALSFFNCFEWSGATFNFDTQSLASLPASFPAAYGFPATSGSLGTPQTGMTLQAEITYAGQDVGLLWLLGGEPIQVSGPIDWYGELPCMDLASATLQTIRLGDFDIPVAFHLVALLLDVPPGHASPPRSAQPVVLGVIAGDIVRPITQSSPGALVIPFYIELYQDPALQIGVVANFQEASSLALADVASLLGVASLDDQQADGFPALADLALQNVTLKLDTTQQQLVSASATVTLTPSGGSPPGTWQPFDILSFDGLAVTFNVIAPLSAAPIYETVVDATATLAGGQLDAWVSLPTLDFGCELKDGEDSPLDLTEILSDMTGGAFGQSFNIYCTQLLVLGNVPANTYRFQATVKDNWTFDVLGVSFALSSVGFDLTYDVGTGGATGQVVATLTVADAVLQLVADYEGAAGGWTFSGGTLGPEAISLTHLLSKVFALSPPASAPKIVIEDISLYLQTGGQTGSMEFLFDCAGQVRMLGRVVDIGVGVGYISGGSPVAAEIIFEGSLEIGPATFTVDFTESAAGDSVLFQWEGKEPLEFEQIAAHFGYEMPPLPGSLDLALTGAEFYYDSNADTIALGAQSKNYGQITFASFVAGASSPNSEQRLYVFEVDVPLNVVLSDLPVVGDSLPPSLGLGVKDLQVIICSATLAAADMQTLKGLMAALDDSPLLPQTLGEGLTLAAELQMGGTQETIVLPLTTGGTTALTSPPATTPSTTTNIAPTTAAMPARLFAASSPPSSPPADDYQGAATWFTVEKSFGPVQFQRIGVQYQNDALFFLLDASLNFGTLSLGLDGLGVGSSLAQFSPEVELDGISVSFSSGPVTISGGLLVVPPSELPQGVAYEYTGAVTIAVSPYLISGVASYAEVNGQPSFFLFAQVMGSFGGPPAFFITGFMGGFGYNSQLTVPTVTQVYDFPFVAGLGDPSIFGQTPTPVSVLSVLSGGGGQPAWTTPGVGDYWIAAGLSFRSFELVTGSALLVVTFGQEFEVALLGLASMTLPQGASSTEAYAFVELQLEAVFKPADGSFSIFAALTPNSYVLTQSCHLTGGFAFCVWFGPSPQAGDFVVTVGGYGPGFVPPPWYPRPAPVGFDWQVDDDVTISGGAYFALTPTAIMAGGSLEALYQSGNLRAWFTAYANVTVWWKPFQFQADIGIGIGASYRLNLLFTTVTVSVELAASLSLWGPPTGGVVNVQWYIISFSIPFGAAQPGGAITTLNWQEFQTLLPSNPAQSSVPAVLGVQVNGGLTQQDPTDGTWIVRADEFVFTTQTAVPAGQLDLGGVLSPPDGSSPSINIRPMNLSGVSSIHSVTITNLDASQPTQLDLTTWDAVAQTSSLPSALWGTPLYGAPPPPTAELVGGLTTGVQLTPPPSQAGNTTGPVPLSLIDVDPVARGVMPLDPSLQADPIPAPVADAAIIEIIMETLASPQSRAAQAGLVAALSLFDAAPPTHEPLTILAAQAGTLFPQAPLGANVYSPPGSFSPPDF